jgi:hypothetical protein
MFVVSGPSQRRGAADIHCASPPRHNFTAMVIHGHLVRYRYKGRITVHTTEIILVFGTQEVKVKNDIICREVLGIFLVPYYERLIY